VLSKSSHLMLRCQVAFILFVMESMKTAGMKKPPEGGFGKRP
jgi:hypothetical protein